MSTPPKVTVVTTGSFPKVIVDTDPSFPKRQKDSGGKSPKVIIATLGNFRKINLLDNLVGGVPAYYLIDFINDTAVVANNSIGVLTSTPGWTYTRADAQTAYAENAAGVPIPFATGVPRITDKGILIETTRTNLALRSRDFTHAAWVKVNVTAGLTETGADGTSNTASLITATAASGTILQSLVAGSFSRAGSCYVKRVVGSGVIEFTIDNGATWTDITSSLSTGAFFRASKVATITNPVIGFRITTSGDAIAVDFAQLEQSSVTSPIPTVDTSAVRAIDILTFTVAGVTYPATIFSEFSRPVIGTSAEHYGSMNFDNNDRLSMNIQNTNVPRCLVRVGGATITNIDMPGTAITGVNKIAMRANTDDFQGAVNGTLGTPTLTGVVPVAPVIFEVGSQAAANLANNFIRRVAIFNYALNDAELQAITT